ncbi:hypothetical protein FHG87_004970 [Trinorchestia longiramus]|nr:hypothetical protein FHG87_004970 [Trinorchestia longiramus]
MSGDAFIDNIVELRAHAQLRRRTASPNRRQSIPKAPHSSPTRTNKYPTDPISDRTRRGSEKPSPPPKLVNPPQAPYKKTFIAMLRGSRDSKKRKSLDRSSGSESPPVSVHSPPVFEEPSAGISRSVSVRTPHTPPPQLLPRQSNPPIPPPVGPKDFRPKSLDAKDPFSHKRNHSEPMHHHLHHQNNRLANNRCTHKHGTALYGSDLRQHSSSVPASSERTSSDSTHPKRDALSSRAAHFAPNHHSSPDLIHSRSAAVHSSSSSSSVQQNIQNFQVLQRAGLMQPYVLTSPQSNTRPGDPRRAGPWLHGSGASSSDHASNANSAISKADSKEPSLGLLTHEVLQFDSAEPLTSYSSAPTISHALVYTHPHHTPQHAIVINPAFLSPHSSSGKPNLQKKKSGNPINRSESYKDKHQRKRIREDRRKHSDPNIPTSKSGPTIYVLTEPENARDDSDTEAGGTGSLRSFTRMPYKNPFMHASMTSSAVLCACLAEQTLSHLPLICQPCSERG